MGTYDQDCKLPKLPVPKLNETIELLKELVEPLVDESSRQEINDAADKFVSGIGKNLQAKLLAKADELPENASWLRPLWDDNYLAWRERLPVNMNYVFQLLGSEWGKMPLENLITSLASVITNIHVNSLPPEETRNGPLSMDTLPYTIYTRIPGAVRDQLYFPLLELPMTAAVVCRGHWFIINLAAKDGKIVSSSSVGNAFAEIKKQALELPKAVPIGAISCAVPSLAASLRDQLQVTQNNRVNLEAIEKSVFVVCLDEPSDGSFVQELITGAAENRWFDKSLQIIAANENIGVNIEHSGCDAGMWIYLLAKANERINTDVSSEGKVNVRRLQWNIQAELEARLLKEAEEYTNFARQISVCQYTFDNINLNNIKAKNCSPDFFVQMLFQATYYRLIGKFVSVYEAVSTRNFYQGRTECVRPVSNASKEFVLALLDNNVDKNELQEKFKQAGLVHSARIKRAQKALGAERHLSGLASILEEMAAVDEPCLLNTSGYQILKHNTISTSSTTAPFIDYFGFGPVEQDGIGIGYGVKTDGMHLSVSAYRNSGIVPDKFVNELKSLAERMLFLL